MAKVKVVKTQLNGNLNGDYFNDTPSNTIFSFGKFFVTTNFDNKVTVDYTNSLSSFVRPVTLETLGVNETQSQIIQTYTTNAVLNLDKSDLNTFVRYGSAYEFLRTSIQNIIMAYPGSLFLNSQKMDTIIPFTYTGLYYDDVTNISTFFIPTGNTVNTFGLVFNDGNDSIPDNNELKNLNLSYGKYVIWSTLEPNTLFKVIGYTGNTVNSSLDFTGATGGTYAKKNYIKVQVEGNPFALMGTGDTGNLDYHLRPNNVTFEEFRALLNNYEKNIISTRDGSDGFMFTLKDPTLLEDGKIIYSDSEVLWSTSDKYNIDVNTPTYQRFLKIVLTIGAKYDNIKTDLIARFLTPASLKTYDFTEEGKITKLLRIYGREFDQIRQFIDSLVNINKVTYNKVNNIPDQLIKNMARTFGWDYFSLINESELVDGFLTVDDTERNLNENILPAEIDIELWRRIINNTSYFWKSKGTRQAIKSMFLLIGIPEPFINITEYVYTVEGKINPNTVPLAQADFPSNSLPYDTSGYPVAPLETNDFYFQLSGNTDSGQAYLDVFRMAGFNLKQTPDNKKSWVQTGATTRIHYSTPQYYQEDSRLVINTKEVDVALDTARGIEYDVYDYIQDDFMVNSSGYTLPYSYVNISSIPQAGNTFTLPYTVDQLQGTFEVRYNGILLNAPSISGVTTTGSTTPAESDYWIGLDGKSFTIPELSGGTRPSDVIQATFISTGNTGTAVTGITVEYIVTRVQAKLGGTYVPLPSYPHGDVQLTINGIALTKGTPQFVADYIVDPANSTGGTEWNIIIQNPDVIAYLNQNPDIQISYMHVEGTNDINLRSEVVRVDSFNTGKIYFNNSANKYVYKLNYKVNQASDVKFLVNGIALEPIKDYNVNVQNPYEIFLPKGIRYGTVISAYYLVGGSGAFDPVVNDVFGLGDISELSFLEFLELVQRKMINARTRKIVTDFKGGWYPSVLRLYETYLERALLPDSNPLQSNGYTFQNLYPFLSKYNAFFQRFVDQLLSATIILRRGGLLIRNSVFTKQKHWYKRGVNIPNPFLYSITGEDMRGNPLVQYLGDDGSKFQIVQGTIAPPPPPPTQLFVETKSGITGSLITGGKNIIGFEELSEYGIDYKRINLYPSYPYGGSVPIGLENLLEGIDYEIIDLPDDWVRISEAGPLAINDFTMTLTGLAEDADYQYRAFVKSPSTGYTGNTLLVHTPPPPLPEPSLQTSTPDGETTTEIQLTGGRNIVRYADVQYYAMQYREVGASTWILQPSSPTAGPLAVNYFVKTITGLLPARTYQFRAYMVVEGIAYYGNILEATTDSIPLAAPEVDTGTAGTASETGFPVNNNEVLDNGVPSGDGDMKEYGILWTTNSTLGSATNLKFTTISLLPSGVYKSSSTTGYPGEGSVWSKNVTGVPANTTVYYRAFARNSTTTNSIGYGTVKTKQTAAPPQVYFGSVVSGAPRFEAINLGSKTIVIHIDYIIEADCDMIGIAGPNSANTRLEISLNGGSTWTLIDEAFAHCNSSSGEDVGDTETIYGSYPITGINSSNIGNIRFRTSYDCSTDRNGQNGYVNIEITSIVPDTGTAEVICPNIFFVGCFNTGQVSCNL